MKKVNSDFLDSLKQYVPDNKIIEYNKFLSELPEWDMKAEKRIDKKNVPVS